MSDSNGHGTYAVKVPRRNQGIPSGVAALASSREPASLAEIERAAVKAIRADSDRAWEWIQFGTTPLPATTVTQQRAANPQRGPHDLAELVNVEKTVYNSPSWRACKPERFKGGRTIPADRPDDFRTEQEAQATLDRYRRLGTEAGVPMSAHLQYAVVAPMSEWEATAGQPTVDRERQEIQAEIQLEALEAQAREAVEALEQARDHAAANKQRTVSGDWTGYGVPNVQKRLTADGSEYFRGRVSGKASPTYETEAEAVAWVEQQKALA